MARSVDRQIRRDTAQRIRRELGEIHRANAEGERFLTGLVRDLGMHWAFAPVLAAAGAGVLAVFRGEAPTVRQFVALGAFTVCVLVGRAIVRRVRAKSS